MDLSQVKELIEMMNKHQLDELEIEEEGRRVRLRKKPEKSAEPIAAFAAPAAYAAPPPAAAGPAPAEPAAAPVAAGESIDSPMVGTFYRSPSPDADSFVDVGDRIEEGKVLCIIEAMKVMNEVKADRSGTIEQILVENGDSVEYGQALFRIK